MPKNPSKLQKPSTPHQCKCAGGKRTNDCCQQRPNGGPVGKSGNHKATGGDCCCAIKATKPKTKYYKPAPKAVADLKDLGYAFLPKINSQTEQNAKQQAFSTPKIPVEPSHRHKYGVPRERIAQISNDISEDMCQASNRELIAVVRYYRDLCDEAHRVMVKQSFDLQLANAKLKLAQDASTSAPAKDSTPAVSSPRVRSSRNQ